ncbi:MAG: MaoC family dehydratase [Alphaproteobacteria bacterium]|nr:MaoC family dehydratase [Alphaproteobacteria bacterium]
MKAGKTFADLAVGMTVSIQNTVSEQDVADFARVSGDYNPVHMDEEYARTSVFGTRVAHGALTASYISAILGNELPGPGAIFTEMTIRFKRPVRIGDTVIATAEVTEMFERGHRVTLAVKCEVDGKVVVKGEAKVMVPGSTDPQPGPVEGGEPS